MLAPGITLFVRTQLTLHMEMELPPILMVTWAGRDGRGGRGEVSPVASILTSILNPS